MTVQPEPNLLTAAKSVLLSTFVNSPSWVVTQERGLRTSLEHVVAHVAERLSQKIIQTCFCSVLIFRVAPSYLWRKATSVRVLEFGGVHLVF